MKKLPTFFISHGGGPWPYVPEMKTQFQKPAQWLQQLPQTLSETPKAILSISGHWEESAFTVSTTAAPEMIFDYTGFPSHTYQIKYPVMGHPTIANDVLNLLSKAGIENHSDPNHGIDHGTFVPLVMMYPNANIPVVSMSIKQNYDTEEHLQAGRALESLRSQGVLIIGSGLSYHNMRGFGSAGATAVSKNFGAWLESTVTEKDIQQRSEKLRSLALAPSAREAHPYEDHLVPLMIVAGAAGQDLGHAEFVDHVMGVDMASYRFGT